MRRGTILIAAVAALALPASASACSCVPLTSKSVKKADAAAVMKLKRVDETGGGSYEEGSGRADFTYRIRKVFKGKLDKGDSVTIESSTSSGACGLPKRRGKRYGLLLDRRKNGGWTSSLCSATTPRRLASLADGRRASARALCS